MNLGTRYIIGMGTLRKKDNSLIFEGENEKIYIPIEQTKEIFCLNEITINTKTIGLLSKHGITLHIFDYFCNYCGSFYPKEKHLSGNMILKQVETYQKKRVEISRNIVKGILKNIQNILYHYYRHGVKDLKKTIDDFSTILLDLDCCTAVETVMSVEAKIWSKFYDSFSLIVDEDYVLNRRERRPPTTPINALISFGNCILYSKTTSQIYQTRLNPTISFLHSCSDRRLSLALDLAEVFKPVIVNRTIFDCINRHKIDKDKHFIINDRGCYLNNEGKKIFIQEINDRLLKTFCNTKNNINMSYLTAIKYDAFKLIKCIEEGREFIPFNDKEKY